MTVTTKSPYRGVQTTTLAVYVERALCDDDSCSIGRTDREIRNLRGSYGRLLLVLAEKGILDADDLSRVVGGTPVSSLDP